MKIFYADIEEDSIAVQTAFTLSEEVDGVTEEVVLKDFTGTLFKTDASGYALVGKADAVVNTVCERCLAPLAVAVKCSITVQLAPFDKASGAAEYEMSEEDGDEYITEKDFADIDDIVRQEILLNLPVRRVCAPECELEINSENTNNSIEDNAENPFGVLAKLKEKLEEK